MFTRPLMRFVPDGTRSPLHAWPLPRDRRLGGAVDGVRAAVLLARPQSRHRLRRRHRHGGPVPRARPISPGYGTGLGGTSGCTPRACRGSGADDVLIRLEAQPTAKATQTVVDEVRAGLEQVQPGSRVLRRIGGRPVGVRRTLPHGLLALGIAPDDPGLHLVPLRMAVRGRRHGHDAARHHHDRLLRAVRVRSGNVAAILTVLGYSTNDKVVVYDRMRENMRKYRTMPLRELIDLSINETLTRTIGTSATVSLASLSLLFGGEMLRGFSIADAVGSRDRHLIVDLHRRSGHLLRAAEPSGGRPIE